jgi:hypothetical protein
VSAESCPPRASAFECGFNLQTARVQQWVSAWRAPFTWRFPVGDARGARGVALRDEPAARMDGQATADAGRAISQEALRTPACAEAKGLVVEQLGHAGGILHLCDVSTAWRRFFTHTSARSSSVGLRLLGWRHHPASTGFKVRSRHEADGSQSIARLRPLEVGRPAMNRQSTRSVIADSH